MQLREIPRLAAVGATALALGLPMTLGAQGQAAQGRAGAQQGQQQGGQQQGQQGRGAGGRAGGRGAAAGQARDPSQQQVTQGTGGLAGAVTIEGSGAPARRARVTLSGPELRPARSTVTDDQGRYSFASLPAAHLTLTASKAGYLDMTYGAKKPGRPGTSIQLADTQKLDHIDIALPKGAVVTGVVVDENGEASPNTQVRVMKFAIRTGDKTLQQAGTDMTDDRGMYRIFGLTPGDYIVSAVPRNANLGDIRQNLQAQIESLMQQAQAANANGNGGGGQNGRGGRGGGGGALNGIAGGRGQQFLDQAAALQQQLAQNTQEPAVAYAPVFYPGTTSAGSAQAVTISSGEERGGVDFQLQLVATARVEGTLTAQDGQLGAGTQVALVPVNENGMPTIPGANTNMTRVDASGHFVFLSVTPGQYTAQARSVIRDPNAPANGRGGAGGGPGGRGGPFGPGGAIQQVLWASADVTVNGQNITNLALNLQPGMTISGRVSFEGTTLAPPSDLTRVRVTLQTRGTQPLEIGGGPPPAQVDATGHFTFTGVAPGTYVLSGGAQAGNGNLGGVAATPPGATGAGRGGGQTAGVAGGVGPQGNWVLKSAMVNGRDTLDFPIEIRPNEDITSALLTFTDRGQAISGTLQDATGRPTPDYTIVVFAADKNYWTPQSRRISTARPSTDGTYTVRGLPAGDYRLTAVTDVEPGEWYDPAFLQQVIGQSIAISLQAGEQKTQDLKLAGGS